MGGIIIKGRGRPDTDGLDPQSATNWIRTYGEVCSIRSAEFRIREKIAALTSGEVTTEDREAVETRLSSDKMLLARLIEDASGETGLYGDIPDNAIQLLIEDPKKLWESATLEQFRENGKYNQISLSDDGKVYIRIIKPGIIENLEVQVESQFVEPIREYLKKNPLNWDSANEGWKNGYSEIGGVYEFFRVIPLLRTREVWIDLKWRGQHTNPVIEGGPFDINDSAEISLQPVSYTETE